MVEDVVPVVPEAGASVVVDASVRRWIGCKIIARHVAIEAGCVCVHTAAVSEPLHDLCDGVVFDDNVPDVRSFAPPPPNADARVT